MRYQRGLVWIRRDLRLHDHRALAEATRQCQQVAIVFVFDVNILDQLQDQDDRRVTFIHASLVAVDRELRKHGAALIVRHGDPQEEIPKVALKIKAEAVFTNRDYEPAAMKRDGSVLSKLSSLGLAFHDYKDQVIFEREEILNRSHQPYKVFTPYKNEWLRRFTPDSMRAEKPRAKAWIAEPELRTIMSEWGLADLGFVQNSLWLEPGTQGGQQRLQAFAPYMDHYHRNRNLPAVDQGTSGISVHLRFGTVSIRECLRFASAHAQSEGAKTWITELIWREFYQMILANFPRVEKHSFQAAYEDLSWPGKPSHFQAWCQAKTGYPIIDAAMRHFNATGWMHNRLRMIVASFLVKDLLIDWKKGEAYFARKLLDFDLASNNGGWQWCASTGTDAQPYFRIFNPVSQARKFDPEGCFIREELPEIAKLSTRHVHAPWEAGPAKLSEAGIELGRDYPKPMVDHAVMRKKALALFASVK